jgi:hypothetical protein
MWLLLIVFLFIPPLAFAQITAIVIWRDNSDNETQFQVERKLTDGEWSIVGTTEANITTYEDTLTSTSACYRVSAGNVSGMSAPSPEACTIPFSPDQLQIELRIPFTSKQ